MSRFGPIAAMLAVAGPLLGAVAGEVALLRNGSLLQGAIELAGDDVLIRSEGSSVRLPAASVTFIGASAADAFEWRRSQRDSVGLSVADHLELAGWALANGLNAEAALELLAAREISPRDPRVKRLELRLMEAMRPVVERTPAAPKKAVTPDEAPEPELELPRLPESGLAYFTRRIQPLVLNGCGSGGCHGGERPAGAFALDRASLRGHTNSASTRANLHAIASAIDLGSPDRSPLLAAAIGPHAGVTPFAGPRRDELLERLASWARDVAAENPQSIPPPEPVVVAQAPTTDESPAAPVDAGPFRPRDEFDPEIFNRRFRTAAVR